MLEIREIIHILKTTKIVENGQKSSKFFEKVAKMAKKKAGWYINKFLALTAFNNVGTNSVVAYNFQRKKC